MSSPFLESVRKNFKGILAQMQVEPVNLLAAARRGAAAKGAYRRCCRSSTMSDCAFVAAPRICPPGARAKMGIYLCASPKNRERLFLVNPGHGQTAMPRRSVHQVDDCGLFMSILWFSTVVSKTLLDQKGGAPIGTKREQD